MGIAVKGEKKISLLCKESLAPVNGQLEIHSRPQDTGGMAYNTRAQAQRASPVKTTQARF